MFQMPEYRDVVSIIPYGLPQFLDFELPRADVAKLERAFWEEELKGQERSRLHVMVKNDDGDYVDSETGKFVGDFYTLTPPKDMGVWYGQWLPIPFLRHSGRNDKVDGSPIFETGPTNWARAYIVPSPTKPDEMYRVVLAFDMQVEQPPEAEGISFALSQADVAAHAVFSLAHKARDNAWFLNEGWVDQWLKESWTAFYKQKGQRMPPAYEDCTLVYLASYLLLLDVLQTAIRGVKVQVINPANAQPVEVDLVLDIGNARTTGMLVETRVQKSTDLNDSYLLQLRDMDKPEFIYTDPFETRVEFSVTNFGNEAYSRRSGRKSQPFNFVSAVRTGLEATRLASLSASAEGTTGMSSPKRYLWDERNWEATWRYNAKGTGERELMVTTGPLAALINDSGTPLCCTEDKRFTRNPMLRRQEKDIAFESKFSRSSLMLQLFIELLQQALMTINSPAQRSRRELPDIPRRLRRVVFTVPAGMPVAEQRIYQRWADWAVKTLWMGLGWEEHYSAKAGRGQNKDLFANPEVWCRWDEATCTQLVYVYNELMRNFQGDAHLFFEQYGKTRAKYDNKPSLRVATIDMGGGTTDLSITTFVLESDKSTTTRVAPRQEIRDGFNIAGDDVLKNIVREVVFKSLAAAMAAQGVHDAPQLMQELFGKNMINSSIREQNLRTQCVRQIGIPAALAILSHYEKKDMHSNGGRISFPLRQIFRMPDTPQQEDLPFTPFAQPHEMVVEYIEKAVRERRRVEFSLMDAGLDVGCEEVDAAIEESVRDILRNMCELVHIYDCDILLLTGRPSCWNAVIRNIFACLPVAPDRIVPMRSYKVGPWYPFADTFGNINDPKTTVIAGAILCALAENSMEGFAFEVNELRLSSTARHIGELDITGRLARDKVWFDVDIADQGEKTYSRAGDSAIEFSAPIVLGFRQLAAERWTATRFYRMEFANENAAARAQGHTPYRIDLNLTLGEMSEDAPEGMVRDEGEFQIENITDRFDNNVNPRDIVILLRTLKREEDEGCWLDTGILY